MAERGYVLCFLKYMLGADTNYPEGQMLQAENAKTICLGYFGRASIAPVHTFKEYMRLSAEKDAEFMGNRKQLLLYSLGDELSGQIRAEDSQKENSLPFRPAQEDATPGFCCLSVVNIAPKVKARLGPGGIRELAHCFSDQVLQIDGDAGIRAPICAVMGLLGAEDLCLIFLGNDFSAICKAMGRLRSLTDGQDGEFLIENSHSILMADFSASDQLSWGDTSAEIQFSLKTAAGMGYLETVRMAIASSSSDVALESQIGEYDAVIRCPASALGDYLYGQKGLLNYANQDYWNIAYQSETTLYQSADLALQTKIPVELGGMGGKVSPDVRNLDEPQRLVREALEKISMDLLGTSEDPYDELAYIRLDLFRMLKDFMRIASLPFGGVLQQDLYVQFQTSVNAIVCAAERFAKTKDSDSNAKLQFDHVFSQIINALNNSMLAANQIDRLNFEEQQSHLYNTGAYHKILLTYYGIVKDILKLMYAIQRSELSPQPMLVPLLSFGHAPIVSSEHFESQRDGKSAKLICITMPYQALTSVPKYIGMLIHELFHYSTPADRETKNEAAGNCLTATALLQVLNAIAEVTPGCSAQAGDCVFREHPEDFFRVAEQMFAVIRKNQVKYAEQMGVAYPLTSDVFFASVMWALNPHPSNTTQSLYCEAWMELRRALTADAGKNPNVDALFCLREDLQDSGAEQHITERLQKALPWARANVRAHLETYEKVLREVPPDLFDIEIALYGQPTGLKVQQYLWQIHSSRCGKFYYRVKRGVDSAQCDGNTIRIGAILDYLMFGLYEDKRPFLYEERQQEIEACLTDQFKAVRYVEDARQKEECERLYNAVTSDYTAYQSESLFAGMILREYIRPISRQIELLFEQEDMRKTAEKLSVFYHTYYQTFVAESGSSAETFFDLSVQMVETYQYQPPMEELCSRCNALAPLPKAVCTRDAAMPRVQDVVWEARAIHPKDLSQKVILAYESIVPPGSLSPLWFRGERLQTRKLFPGIMRDAKEGEKGTFSEKGFQAGMRRMLTLAKAKILPKGTGFHPAEWLAFLQHNEFKTNLMDWSEDFHSALFFAIQRWIEKPDNVPEGDAVIYVFNPILYNLAKDALESKFVEGKEDGDLAFARLRHYLESGSDKEGKYAIPLFTRGETEHQDDTECYYNLDIGDEGDNFHLPIAAMTPANSERMKVQAGVFLFFDVRSQPQEEGGMLTYRNTRSDLEKLQNDYLELYHETSLQGLVRRPFLFKIILNRSAYKEFAQYIHAVGIRKYKMYPEIDKLADDIANQAF